MNLKSIVLLLIISITQACGAKKNVNSRSETMWISGYQTICDKGTGKSECWLMTTSTNLATAKWEYFHNTIEGFNFEPGFIQKIEVKVKDSNEKLISADRSTLEYSLLKVLKKKKDTRVALQDHWYLERIIGLNTDETDEFPYLTFDLNKNSFSGSDGCNNFFGNIKHVGLQIINLERIFTTVRECDAKINSFNKIFNTITAYKIKKSALVFYDANKMKVMAFTKKNRSTGDLRIHDIFVARKMNGIEIKKKGEMPSLEINLNTMKIYGTNGCNNFRGVVHAASEKTIVFKGLTFSKKECLNMDFALQFNQALEKTAGYKYEELHLTFYDKDGKELITFMKVD